MHQMIEGLDNEVTFVLLFITLLLAIVIPLYVMKPNRNNDQDTYQENDSNDNSSRQENIPEPSTSSNMPRHMPMPQPEPGPSTSNIFNDNVKKPPDIGAQSSDDKPRESNEKMINVKVLHQETYRHMNVSNNMQLKDFKEACFPEEFAAEKTIRMIYAGKILQGDTYPLRYLGIMNGSVIHCVISEQNNMNGRSSEPANIPNDLDISDYFMHLVGLSLIGTWTIFIMWTNLMSAMSIAVLIFLTIIFIGWTFYS